MVSLKGTIRPLQVGIGGVVKLADFGPLGRLGCARAAEACTYSAPEVLRKVGVLAASRAFHSRAFHSILLLQCLMTAKLQCYSVGRRHFTV